MVSAFYFHIDQFDIVAWFFSSTVLWLFSTSRRMDFKSFFFPSFVLFILSNSIPFQILYAMRKICGNGRTSCFHVRNSHIVYECYAHRMCSGINISLNGFECWQLAKRCCVNTQRITYILCIDTVASCKSEF